MHLASMGFRGVRPGLRAVLLLLLLTALTAPVAANPYIGIGEEMSPEPILLVIINYPIDGCVLLLGYGESLKKKLPLRPSGELAFALDFAMAVLLFSLIGSLIDTFVTQSYATVPSMAIGLAAIALSCLLISRRYLRMDRQSTTVTIFAVTAMNFGSWAVLYGLPAETFLVVCFPIVVGFWIAFDFLLFKTAMKVNMLTAASMRKEGSNAMAAPAQDAEGHTAKPNLSCEDRLRTELVVISFVLLVLVLSAPIFLKPI